MGLFGQELKLYGTKAKKKSYMVPPTIIDIE
jgi:hypothetical protein